MWVKNVLGYFACGCRMSWDILCAGVEYPRIFCMWVKNVLGYFACGCKLS